MSILALTSDTLIGTAAAGNIEYNGQFFGTDSNNSRAQMQRIVRGTAVTASGTSVNFTDIPAWVERITVMFSGVSGSGTSNFLLQIGDAGGIENTGYSGGSFNAGATANSTAGFDLTAQNAAAQVWGGSITLTNLNGNIWCQSGVISGTSAGYIGASGGAKELSATLDRVRITTVGGTETFDAGTINLLLEG